MKTSPFFCRTFVLGFFITSINVFASNALVNPDSSKNYVVIGAFAKERNALRFVIHVKEDLQLSAKSEFNGNRSLYYVYSFTTDDHSEAINEAKRLRSETELLDAWVYNGNFSKEVSMPNGIDVNPSTKQVIENIKAQDVKETKEVQTSTVPKVEEVQQTELTKSEEVLPTGITKESSTTIKENTPLPSNTFKEEEVTEVDNSPGKPFIFKLVRKSDQTEVIGSVDVVDPDKAKIIKKADANKTVKIVDVKNKSGKLVLMGQAFGYRKVQRTINYKATASDSAISIDPSGRTIVPFELERLKKGDFAIMYNVFFFRDAAVMRPESKIEVDLLADMMRENPNCVIRLHGHTNGNHAGKIIYWGEGTSDFFSLNGSRDDYGSAKELSGARASAIQAYLISEGVEPSRCSVKAWGGKKAIHDKLSARAGENVRVEIEIVKDN